MNKEKLLYLLMASVVLDIVLTFVCVIYLNATEINPLCFNFTIFFVVKCIVSIIMLIFLRVLINKEWVHSYAWLSCVYFLIIWYNIITLNNVYGIYRHFFL